MGTMCPLEDKDANAQHPWEASGARLNTFTAQLGSVQLRVGTVLLESYKFPGWGCHSSPVPSTPKLMFCPLIFSEYFHLIQQFVTQAASVEPLLITIFSFLCLQLASCSQRVAMET